MDESASALWKPKARRAIIRIRLLIPSVNSLPPEEEGAEQTKLQNKRYTPHWSLRHSNVLDERAHAFCGEPGAVLSTNGEGEANFPSKSVQRSNSLWIHRLQGDSQDRQWQAVCVAAGRLLALNTSASSRAPTHVASLRSQAALGEYVASGGQRLGGSS